MYDNEDNTTLDTLSDEQTNVGSADVEGAVSQPSASSAALTLEQLNTVLGKDYKDTETALKSVKDTFNYVGKKREDVLKDVVGNTETLTRELKEIKENMFYQNNPQFAEHRALISKLGSNPEEAVSTPEFKILFEKADGFNKLQSQKSVLVSNPRLASSKDNMTKATEARFNGDIDSMEKHATAAVLDLLK